MSTQVPPPPSASRPATWPSSREGRETTPADGRRPSAEEARSPSGWSLAIAVARHLAAQHCRRAPRVIRTIRRGVTPPRAPPVHHPPERPDRERGKRTRTFPWCAFPATRMPRRRRPASSIRVLARMRLVRIRRNRRGVALGRSTARHSRGAAGIRAGSGSPPNPHGDERNRRRAGRPSAGHPPKRTVTSDRRIARRPFRARCGEG
jgi:hypothetical protein